MSERPSSHYIDMILFENEKLLVVVENSLIPFQIIVNACVNLWIVLRNGVDPYRAIKIIETSFQ